LLQGIRRFLPRKGLPLLVANRRICWTPRLLVICAILMAWSKAQTLGDRFADARLAVCKLYSSRKRPGRTCEGFMAALCRMSKGLLELVSESLRASVRQVAGAYWTVEGWLAFSVDGSKLECPMTRANERAFGRAGREKSTPQQFLTMLLHLGTGLSWAWRRGPGRSSERKHLRQMLHLLPEKALLVADAGFTGYELLSSIIAGGRHFLVRVGSNVRLLRKLGYRFREHAGIVYLWPENQRDCPPLVLRLVVRHDGRKPVYLLSSVLAAAQLSDQAAGRLYRLRWGIEVHYRSLKQTMGRKKLLSDSPRHARVELDWMVVGHWIMTLLAVSNLIAAGQNPRDHSVGQALRVLRTMLYDLDRRCERGALGRRLGAAVQDRYVRTSHKKARHWPHKKNDPPPGRPKFRMATRSEVRQAQELRSLRCAA
jgi:hypothetical protein